MHIVFWPSNGTGSLSKAMPKYNNGNNANDANLDLLFCQTRLKNKQSLCVINSSWKEGCLSIVKSTQSLAPFEKFASR